MRDNLFSRYKPKLISELKKGDKVWLVHRGKNWVIYAECLITEIEFFNSGGNVTIKYEPTKNQYPYRWCYASWYIRGNIEKFKTVAMKDLYGARVFSDFLTLKHSVLHRLRRQEKAHKKKLKKIMESLEYIKKVRESF